MRTTGLADPIATLRVGDQGELGRLTIGSLVILLPGEEVMECPRRIYFAVDFNVQLGALLIGMDLDFHVHRDN